MAPVERVAVVQVLIAEVVFAGGTALDVRDVVQGATVAAEALLVEEASLAVKALAVAAAAEFETLVVVAPASVVAVVVGRLTEVVELGVDAAQSLLAAGVPWVGEVELDVVPVVVPRVRHLVVVADELCVAAEIPVGPKSVAHCTSCPHH